MQAFINFMPRMPFKDYQAPFWLYWLIYEKSNDWWYIFETFSTILENIEHLRPVNLVFMVFAPSIIFLLSIYWGTICRNLYTCEESRDYDQSLFSPVSLVLTAIKYCFGSSWDVKSLYL